jgi:hypothetical protein
METPAHTPAREQTPPTFTSIKKPPSCAVAPSLPLQQEDVASSHVADIIEPQLLHQAVLKRTVDSFHVVLELLGVHETDRDSGMVEDAHHLARHVVCDDGALCAAAA